MTESVSSRGIGLPDYSQPKPTGSVPVGPVYTMTDMAELAARIAFGVPDTFDRRGNVIWADGFEDNIAKWYISGTGTGHGAALSVNAAQAGAKSGELITGSDAPGNHIDITKYMPYPFLSANGFEISFTYNANAQFYDFHLHLYDGDNLWAAEIRLSPSSLFGGELQLLTSAGSWQMIGIYELSAGSGNYLFNTLKMVVNFNTKKYVRVILNNTEYDLSLEAVRSSSYPAIAPVLIVSFSVATNAAAARTIYVDNAIITQNEPVNN